jgi:hypothetical protein
MKEISADFVISINRYILLLAEHPSKSGESAVRGQHLISVGKFPAPWGNSNIN